MKKILLMEAGSFTTFGGAASATYSTYQYLKKFKGYDVDLFGDFSKIDKKARSVGKNKLGSKKYDVVFLNSIRDVPLVLKYMKPKKQGRTKFVYTDRGNVLLNFRNAKLKKFLPKMLVRQYFMYKMRFFLGCYVALSAEQQEDSRRFFGNDMRIEYIPMAQPEDYINLHIERRIPGALYVGRLDERQKKVGFLIRGVERVLQDNDDIEGEVLRIIGTGPHEGIYKQYVKSKGLEEHITFVGFVDENALIDSYNLSQFFVSCSEWEGMSRTFVEAMACGLPLLVNNKNNTEISVEPKKNLVTEGYNGLIYEYGNIKSFAEKFYSLYSDIELRVKLSKNATTFAKKFSMKKNLQSYKRIIDTL